MKNIFSFATSELSQDAMIAWLMECANATDSALQEVGREFIKFLLDRPCGETERAVIDSAPEGGRLTTYDGPGSVFAKVEVETQWKHIDVYCRAEIDGQMVSFVIEDKTHSKEHSHQLTRYKGLVRDDDDDEDYLKLIYLKTGMPYKDELDRAEAAEYCHVGVSDLEDFLHRDVVKRATNYLLGQYQSHIAAQAQEQRDAERCWNIHDWGPVQFLFAEEIKMRTAETNSRFCPDSDEPDQVWHGTNNGGGDWTQYRFFGMHLFWRLDSWKPLRMMVDLGYPPGSPDIQQYRTLFKEACDEVEGIERARVRFKTGKQTTLGAINCPKAEDMDEFLDRLARVHEGFLRRIARAEHPREEP